MPIPVFQLQTLVNENATDAALRAQFVTYTMNLLGFIVQNNAEDNLNAAPIRPEVAARMQAAWQEWQEASPNFFENLVQSVQQNNNEVFMNHGLCEAQLRFKLANVEWWSQQTNLAAQDLDIDRWRASIKRLFDSIDPVINSILEVLGDEILGVPGAGSALIEIKDAIKNAIND